MENYKKFEYNYDKKRLLDFYNFRVMNGYGIPVGPLIHVDHQNLINYCTPGFDLVIDQPNPTNFGIAKIRNKTGLHCTPRNNGLIIFPLEGTVVYDFYSYVPNPGRPKLLPYNLTETQTQEIMKTFVESVRIDQPTAINGLVVHNYYPLETSAVFYAVKIPVKMTWEDVLKRL